METPTAFQRALTSLQTTGVVTMPGRPAGWSRLTKWLFLVLIGLVSLLPTVALVLVVVTWGQVESTAATVLGLIAVLVMTAVLAMLVILGHRRHARFSEVERQDVTLDTRGLTLRGVGPIPWRDFGPAQHRMVRSEYSDGFVRRAVMPLTPSGFATVNERTPQSVRRLICPATGPFWNRRHRWIYVPGVEGMRQAEVMQVINTAHGMFADRPAPERA